MLKPTSRRGLTFADAVQLLGGGETPFLALLGRVAGGGAGVAAAATLSSVDLLAVRNEVVEQGQRAARRIRERQAGLSRYDRTQLIAAAHTVLVVSSFFETLDEVAAQFGLEPSRFDLNLTEQVALGTGAAAEVDREGIVRALTDNDVPMPSPAVPIEALLADLRHYYRRLTTKVLEVARDLTTGERMRVASDENWDNAVEAALRRYRIAYRGLAAEVPEFAIWAAMLDAEAGRAATGHVGEQLRTGLAGVQVLLDRLRTGDADVHRAGLADQYRLDLNRPILDARDLPAGIRLPAAGDLYVNHRARARRAVGYSPVATDWWWAGAYDVGDLQPFLAGCLTGPEAVLAPLIVLGHPGSGKSLLSRVLAARLPASDFLPVRVELRAVAADAPLQDQIEGALYQTLGERVTWPELVRSAGGALPVVMLDGFDELLQASGRNRADYLEQVRDFQRREADRGRPVVVLVTSRTVVADRARVPAGSLVLRLEPFDDDQVRCWLRVWAETNSAGLAARSLTPLTADAALNYPELAEQPLLLLMLALYDAGDNVLQRAGGGLDRADLYERLFTDFARREIAKREPAAPPDSEPAAIAKEIYCLELVAFAMFARGAQMIVEEQLDADVAVLLRDDPIGVTGRAADRPLTAAQLLAGRFFFIHESRALPGVDLPERSYEFLHATFGEFLVARLVVGELVRLVGERKHQADRLRPGIADVGPLYAWLSFAVLTGRASIVEFCRFALRQVSPAVQAGCRRLLLDLLREAAFPPPARLLTDYRPVRLAESARHAAFTANLVVLAVLLSPDGVDAVELFPDRSWRSHALLWESQLPSDAWRSLWQTIRMTSHLATEPIPEEVTQYATEGRLTIENHEAVHLFAAVPWNDVVINLDAVPSRPYQDVAVSPDSTVGEWLREAAFRGDQGLVRYLTHSLAPYWRHVAASHRAVDDDYPPGTDTAALLEVVLAPRRPQSVDAPLLAAAYTTCLDLFLANENVQAVLMRTLEADAAQVDPDVVLTVLSKAVHLAGGGEHNYWTADPEALARMLATVHARRADADRIRAIWVDWDAVNDMVAHPEEPSFGFFMAKAFARLGREIPDEINRR